MNKLIQSLLLTALSLAACDAPEEAQEFRDGPPPEVLYLSQFDAEISVFDFANMVLACPAKPHLAVTFSRYLPVQTIVDNVVIGLGFSVTADAAWADCYEDLMLSMGAHP